MRNIVVRRILLAEDDEGIRTPIAAMLTHHGYEVILASDGKEFISSAHQAEVWIIDVRLPTGSYEGILAVAELASKGILPTRPIIFISVDPEQFATEMLEAIGRFGIKYSWLEKPFEIELLLLTITQGEVASYEKA